jgi:hypothetical protein
VDSPHKYSLSLVSPTYSQRARYTAKPPGKMLKNRRLCLKRRCRALEATAASSGPSNRRTIFRAVTRPNPAIIHPRGRGVCRPRSGSGDAFGFSGGAHIL